MLTKHSPITETAKGWRSPLRKHPVSKSMREKPNENGQSLVEFGVSVVILLILSAGVVDAGRAFFVYMAMRDAVQEGALFGS